MHKPVKRCALVTGANRGVGLAIGEALADRGHDVIALTRDLKTRPNERFTWFETEVTQSESLARTVKSIFKSHDVDAVVSNAGAPAFGNLENWSTQGITDSLALNLNSHLILSRLVIPYLRRQPSSDLCLMGSLAALKAGKEASIYCAAKAGLKGFAQSLRQEASASGVRVTLLSPGMVDTDFYRSERFAPGPKREHRLDPQDIASALIHVIESPPHVVYDEVVLTPLKHVLEFKTS